MKALNSMDGFILHGWMVTGLGLGGYELMTYALVHQFSQSKAGLYKGGVPYLAAWLQTSEMTARKYLHLLEDKGLIRSKRGTDSGVPYCYYEVVENDTLKNFGGTPKNFEGDPTNFGVSTPKNFGGDNNIDNNKENNKPPFIPPTKNQVSDYAAERGFIDPDGFAAHFVDYYTQAQQSWHLANGRPMKDWKRAVITWEPGNKYRHFGPSQAQRPRYGSQQATAVDDLLAMGAELYGINTNYDEQ
jgi:hypothetical protein